ncbi:MAG: hypothetical protein WCW36_02540 [Candidatus Paceibacterota bacterium]|jgi:hypothetical protein
MGKKPLFTVVAAAKLRDRSIATILAFPESWTAREIAVDALGATNVRNIIDCGYALSKEQAQEMADVITSCDGGTGIRNWVGHHFLVETGDPNEPVSVGYIARGKTARYVCVSRFGLGCRHEKCFGLIVRNLDLAKF